jgi:hypothetical protein
MGSDADHRTALIARRTPRTPWASHTTAAQR